MDSKYKNIMVGVDGSDQSEGAFFEAIGAARRNEAKLYVVQIIDDSSLLINSAQPMNEILAEESERAKQYLEKLAERGRYQNMEIIPYIGNPKRALTEELPQKYEIDLIYVGATGKGRFQRLLVGSTSGYIVNHAPCNVMVVR
ncbi:universal stress protein [Enterococcus dongliensis]|uniref:Universal stress protein n=1 Tax=Enterococcus dongliensis TaxID=2559925 RepID=A0AAP5KRI6_9ENTE|nr:universal stress protein [Enterococcus dongliensis]MDT2597271.1 universal stress protein [Enterococcus dongliensis]MDT2603975.1 universal stress protein [Enterococcus dongliensis]MDT2634905.1 universal stress protein [Enterococcus dongliensis]MDT2638050.1 universal stress protein [Enterococcus dongliensis]MDT2638662.1 universal stress protein [Enterococcus dongliensis]